MTVLLVFIADTSPFETGGSGTPPVVRAVSVTPRMAATTQRASATASAPTPKASASAPRPTITVSAPRPR